MKRLIQNFWILYPTTQLGALSKRDIVCTIPVSFRRIGHHWVLPLEWQLSKCRPLHLKYLKFGLRTLRLINLPHSMLHKLQPYYVFRQLGLFSMFYDYKALNCPCMIQQLNWDQFWTKSKHSGDLEFLKKIIKVKE